MKRILIAVTTLFGGGAERVASVWANELAESGYCVAILVYGRCKDEYPIDKGVSVLTVADTYKDYKGLSYFSRVKAMRRIVKKFNPDVLISFLPRMQIWMMLSTFGIKIKRIETVRVSPWSTFSNDNCIEAKIWRLCFRLADSVIVQTNEQARYFPLSIQKKSVTIPNPISPDYQSCFIRNYQEKRLRFIAAGRITKQKNYPMMIKAFARAKKLYPNITLDIWGVGEEQYLSYLEQLVVDYCNNGGVYFRGRSNTMPLEYLKHDAFLMSSLFEGMPNALLEAMACGLVCISTDCKTGPKDLISDGRNGFLVQSENEEQFYDSICKVCELTMQEAERIGVNARNTVLTLCNKESSLAKLIAIVEKD